MFAQVLGEETLEPDRKKLSYTGKFKGTLEPGSYQVTGMLVANAKPTDLV